VLAPPLVASPSSAAASLESADDERRPTPRPRPAIEEPPDDPLERIFRTDCRHQNVDAERQRWQAEALAHAGRLF